MIRRTILFDNQCGFALGENSRAPNPYVTWRFNEQDGQRNYFWGHYMNEPDMAERDLLNRAEDYQRRYHVQEVEQAPDKETYLYYSTQRPIDIGTYSQIWYHGKNQSDGGIRMDGQEKLLDYETIKAAVAGEKWATEKVLAHYADYIDELSTVEIRQPGGKVKKVIDEDMRQHISLKLLEALPSFPLEQE